MVRWMGCQLVYQMALNGECYILLWTVKNPAGFQATVTRGVFKSALQPQDLLPWLHQETELLWRTLTGPWPGMNQWTCLPFPSLSHGNLLNRSLCCCCNSSRVFGQNPWATDENTRVASWCLEREDDTGGGEPAAGRFPLSPCLVHFRQFSSDPAPPSGCNHLQQLIHPQLQRPKGESTHATVIVVVN
jgi:hypothetical protein